MFEFICIQREDVRSDHKWSFEAHVDSGSDPGLYVMHIAVSCVCTLVYILFHNLFSVSGRSC